MAAQAGKAKPGSVSALIEKYYRSADWNALAPITKESFRRVYERFRQEYGAGPVNQLTPKYVNRIMDKMADRPGAAANLRKRLSTLFAWAVADGWIETNPVTLSKRVRHVVKGIRTWTEEDITAFRKRWPLGTPQRLAMEILLYTGLRRSDAVGLGPKHRVNGVFSLSTSKSRGKTVLMIPIHPNLRTILDRVPADHETYLATAYGKPRSEKALTTWLKEAAKAAGLPANSSPHGLRKAACRRLAEAGCSPHHIQAITGHKALAEVELYTRDVRQKLLAEQAMARWIDAFPEQEVPNPG
jgi:integrase